MKGGTKTKGRPSHEGRGLKYNRIANILYDVEVVPLTRDVD